jgi:glutathione S-transferase
VHQQHLEALRAAPEREETRASLRRHAPSVTQGAGSIGAAIRATRGCERGLAGHRVTFRGLPADGESRLKLYTFVIAPNPTKVNVYLAEKGIEVEKVSVNLREGEQRSAEHLARNPLARLPVLELDDGSLLTESLAIIEYLEELHPEPPMIGRTPLERARVREIERLVDLDVLMRVARIIHATRSPLGLPPNPAVAEPERKRLPQVLAALEARIGEQPFLAGERPTIADCTLFAAFRFADFGGVEIDPACGRLRAWYARFAERPSARS